MADCNHPWQYLQIQGGWGAAGCAYVVCVGSRHEPGSGCGESFALDLDELWPRKLNARTAADVVIRKATDDHFGAKASKFYAAEDRASDRAKKRAAKN